MDTIDRDAKKVKVYIRLKFLDSFRFMDTSSGKLVKTIDRFEHTGKYLSVEQQELLRRKEVYPYNYMTGVSKFAETELPSKEAFNTWMDSGTVSCSDELDEMRPKEISDEDYAHAKKVWDALECKNLGDYTDAYCKIDTFQLADVMETGSRALRYGCGSLLGWHVESDGRGNKLLTDRDMYLFFEEGIRGGVSSATKRYSKATNKYMKDYDPKEIRKYIVYNDKNGLYTSVLCGPLPIGGFT